MRPAWLLVALVIPITVLAAVGDPPISDKSWTNKYDAHFRKYAKHYFGPHVNWRWFKAQAIAESNLKPNARSAAGAKGIMQIMPSTFKEIRRQNPHMLSISDSRWNIAAGIYYDRLMYRKWDKNIPMNERLAFAFGSYNAGYGGVRKAYRKAEKKHEQVDEWQKVAPYSPAETRKYVERIRHLMSN